MFVQKLNSNPLFYSNSTGSSPMNKVQCTRNIPQVKMRQRPKMVTFFYSNSKGSSTMDQVHFDLSVGVNPVL